MFDFFTNGSFARIIEFLSEYLMIKDLWSLILTIADVGIVAYIIYKLINMIKETRGWQLLKGVVILLLVTVLSDVIGLRTISYLLKYLIQFLAIALVVLFQAELRKALEMLGTSKIKNVFNMEAESKRERSEKVVKEVATAVVNMSATRTGALIVIERDFKLGEIVQSGILMDSEISSQLLEQIFVVNTPLHDGAVVIRDGRIIAATCLLPLTSNSNLSKELGTRHRAAIGITEISDCITVVVSEETGKISLVKNGVIKRNYDKETLEKDLSQILISEPQPKKLLNLRREKK